MTHGPFAFNALPQASANPPTTALPSGRKSRITLSLTEAASGPATLAPLLLTHDLSPDMRQAEFRQSLHEAGLMEKRARLIRKNRILRMDRKATCLHELRDLVNETLAQGGR